MPEKDENGEDELRYFTHKAVVPYREDDVSKFTKDAKTQLIVRTFDKLASVFSDWKEDDEKTAIDAINNDLKLWHCDKFVKDPDELEDLNNVVRKYAKELKAIFL